MKERRLLYALHQDENKDDASPFLEKKERLEIERRMKMNRKRLAKKKCDIVFFFALGRERVVEKKDIQRKSVSPFPASSKENPENLFL